MTDAAKRFLTNIHYLHREWLEGTRERLTQRKNMASVHLISHEKGALTDGDVAAIEYYLDQLEKIADLNFAMLVQMSANIRVDEQRMREGGNNNGGRDTEPQ